MNVLKIVWHLGAVLCLSLLSIKTSYAVDSYRFLHVHIDTIWIIFLFLLGIIFVPFILIAVLTWYYAGKKADSEDQQTISDESEK